MGGSGYVTFTMKYFVAAMPVNMIQTILSIGLPGVIQILMNVMLYAAAIALCVSDCITKLPV
jgi:hypothetical protein